MEQVQGKLWGENTRKILLRAPDMDSCKGWVSNLQELCPLHLKELDKVNKTGETVPAAGGGTLRRSPIAPTSELPGLPRVTRT